MMVRLTGIINLLAFNSYFGAAVIFAFLSFTGVWALYRTFLSFFPAIPGQLALAVLFIPSVFFWGSGILKDTVVLGCLGWLTYTVFQVFIKGNWSLSKILFMVISFWLVMVLKGYVLLAFAPALAFLILATYKSRITSDFLRIIVTPLLLVVTVAVAGLIITQMSDSLGKYSLENMERTASATQNWHHMANTEGAVYSLAMEDFSLGSLVTTFPAAVNVTFFRPYLWEAGGAVGMMSALESFLLLLFFITILLKVRVIGIVRYMNHPFIQFALVFALIFGFAVGLTSYNFGALARYKIQAMPFFVGALFMIRYQMKMANEVVEEEEELVEEGVEGLIG